MMQVKWTRGLSLAILSAAVLLMASPAAYANCSPGVGACNNNAIVYLQGCGTQDMTLYTWTHKAGIQRRVSTGQSASKTAGNDIGTYDYITNANLVDLFTAFGGAPPFVAGDWLLTCIDSNSTGNDGCGTEAATTLWEADATCACGVAANCGWRPMNALLGGVDPAQPLVGRMGLMSADFDPPFATYNWDDVGQPTNAGCALGTSPAVCTASCADPRDVDPGVVFGTAPIPCFAIPVPGWASKPTCAGGTCNITMNIGDSSGLAAAIADDCNVAESRAVNCPRNLYSTRRLFGRRAACDTTTFDLRTFPPTFTAPGTESNLTPNWFALSPQDLNLNGVQDGGETTFTFVDIPGTGATPKAFTLPVVNGATDCLFIAMGIVVDGSPLAGYEPVVSTVVSVNGNPYQAGTGTPVTDRVYGIRAAKAQGQTTISWSTTGEFSTAGFNVYGGKKSGETKLNSSQIAAKEGTTGNGASYQISVGSGSLKGSTNIFVEVVKTDGTSERFGPASVK